MLKASAEQELHAINEVPVLPCSSLPASSFFASSVVVCQQGDLMRLTCQLILQAVIMGNYRALRG